MSKEIEEIEEFDVSQITGITSDSRKVKPGYLFAALPGETHDGHDYIEDALKNGASVILSAKRDLAINPPKRSLFVSRETLRKAYSAVVGKFYDKQPDNLVAVTGTNGKSSVVHFINQIWLKLNNFDITPAKAGIKEHGREDSCLRRNDKIIHPAFIGTLSGALTTPDPVTFHETLMAMSENGVTHCALEASSHGLSQYRIDGARIKVGAFTNFTQDHLDYHETMEEYLNAKLRLFIEIVQETAVLNADIPEFEALKKACKHLKIITYGERGDLSLDLVKDIPLIGTFQKMNALCALGCVLAEDGIDKDKAVAALKTLEPAPGRLQYVTNAEKTKHIYVDYAHTPDALKTVLKELRPYANGRLICLFGCGGDRDKAKRPLMGRIAEEYADEVIITDDNPRSEKPEDIRAEIRKNMRHLENVHDIKNRRNAICYAIKRLNPDDVLLVAGKGHERVQILADRTEEFDDVEVVKSALS